MVHFNYFDFILAEELLDLLDLVNILLLHLQPRHILPVLLLMIRQSLLLRLNFLRIPLIVIVREVRILTMTLSLNGLVHHHLAFDFVRNLGLGSLYDHGVVFLKRCLLILLRSRKDHVGECSLALRTRGILVHVFGVGGG